MRKISSLPMPHTNPHRASSTPPAARLMPQLFSERRIPRVRTEARGRGYRCWVKAAVSGGSPIACRIRWSSRQSSWPSWARGSEQDAERPAKLIRRLEKLTISLKNDTTKGFVGVFYECRLLPMVDEVIGEKLIQRRVLSCSGWALGVRPRRGKALRQHGHRHALAVALA